MRSFLTRLHFTWKYFGHPPWDTDIPAPELVRRVSGHNPGKALDIGCGTGTNLLYLAQHGWKVCGVDYTPQAIVRARHRFHQARLAASLIIGDVTTMAITALGGPYDLILDIGCLHAFSSDEEAVNRYVDVIRSGLSPGGTFLLYAHMPETGESDRPWHGITPGWAQDVFTDDFSLIAFEPGQDIGRQSAWYTF